MSNAQQQNIEDELEIGLGDIINFFVTYWRFLTVGIILGFVIALGGVLLLLDKYEAKITILTKPVIATYSIWANLRRELPILAAQIAEREKNRSYFFNVLSSEEWWSTNITPTYTLSKEDAKNVFGLPKTIEGGAAMSIENLVLTGRGQSEEEALTNLSMAASFIRSGVSYLTLKKYIADYEILFHRSEPQIKSDILLANKQLAYLNRHMVNFKFLRDKFPRDAVNLPIDLKGPDVKYLPLATQIIALSNDIRVQNENLTNLNDSLAQLTITASFLTQASQVLDKSFDGISAISEFEQIESSLRKNISHTDLNSLAVLNNIRNSIATMHTDFSPEFGKPFLIKTTKLLHLKYIAIGLAFGFFLALLGSFFSAIWLRYRRNITMTGITGNRTE